jgi:hypothetical protein
MAGAMLLAWLLRWGVIAGVILTALGGAYVYVKRIGYAECHAEVTAAIVKEAGDGEKARTDAERDVARDTPRELSDDPRNRDNWKQ